MSDHTKRTPPRPRLGRGLSSLISTPIEPSADAGHYQPAAAGGQHPPHVPPPHEPTGRPVEIPVDAIGPNPYQPRRRFNDADLAELAASIRQQGVLQPLIVARAAEQSGPHAFIVVAGERRLRAARQAGLPAVPCVVREATPQQMLEWALVENIQRADLNPVERARAYQEYIDRFSLGQAEAAERLGQPRTTVANYLRILDLEDEIQTMLTDGTLSFGHAKVLAGLTEGRLALARRAARRGLSVRQLEALAGGSPAHAGGARPPARQRPAYLVDAEDQMTRALGTKVSIHPARAKNTGRVVIEYYSLDDFDRIAAALGVSLES